MCGTLYIFGSLLVLMLYYVLLCFRPEHGHGGGDKWIWASNSLQLDRVHPKGEASDCPADLGWKYGGKSN